MAISEKDFKKLGEDVTELRTEQGNLRIEQSKLATQAEVKGLGADVTQLQIGQGTLAKQAEVTQIDSRLESLKATVMSYRAIAIAVGLIFGLGGGLLFVKVIGSAAEIARALGAALGAIADSRKEAIGAVIDEGSHQVARIEAAGSQQVSRIEQKAAAELEKLRACEMPIGTIAAWPSGIPVPEDWRVCDGSTIPSTKAMWAVLRGHYGNLEAEEMKDIILPNFQGYFLRGSDPKGEVDKDGPSRTVGTAQSDSIGPHSHDLAYYHNAAMSAGAEVAATSKTAVPVIFPEWVENTRKASPNTPIYALPLGMAGSKPDGETRPKNMVVQWIIRVGPPANVADASASKPKK